MAGWQRAQPVHVVVAPQLVPAGGVNAWKAGIDPAREVTVTGIVRPLGGLVRRVTDRRWRRFVTLARVACAVLALGLAGCGTMNLPATTTRP